MGSHCARGCPRWFVIPRLIAASRFDQTYLYPAVVAWKLRSRYTRRKARAISIRYTRSDKSSLDSLMDSKVVYVSNETISSPFPLKPAVGWEPQIRNVTLPSDVTVPPVAYTRSPNLEDELPPTPNSGPSLSLVSSPPNVYRTEGLHFVPVPPTPPESAFHDISPPTPMSKSTCRSSYATTPEAVSFDLSPVPSPRSSSFSPTSGTLKSSLLPAFATAFSPKSLPRLMLVKINFNPTRDDELAVRSGEILHLIKEFEDEWCLVQRVGRGKAELGVIPRFCLVERPRVRV
jgi:hypothetical protein